MEKLNSFQQQNILDLLYSGSPANELLAFEMIKHLNRDRVFLIPLKCLQWLTKDEQLSKDIQEYFSRFEESSNCTSYELDLIERLVRRRIFIFKVLEQFKSYFPHEEILNLLFYLAIKSGNLDYIKSFLIYDNGEHPKRKLVVDKLISVQFTNYTSRPYCIAGLFYEELEEVGKKCWIMREGNLPINWEITDLKTKSIPPVFNKFRLNMVYIKSMSQEYISVFPQYLYSFRTISFLDFSIKNLNVFPTKFINRVKLRRLTLNCTSHVRFKDFDFLQSFSGLESLDIKGGKISNPSIFLGHDNVGIHIDETTQFQSMGNYNIQVTKIAIPNIANYLNEMPITEKERTYYYPKLLALKNLANMSSFSEEELKRLEKFIPTEKGKSRITHWAIRKELRLRSLGSIIDSYITKAKT